MLDALIIKGSGIDKRGQGVFPVQRAVGNIHSAAHGCDLIF